MLGIDKLIINEKVDSAKRFRLSPYAKTTVKWKEELRKAS